MTTFTATTRGNVASQGRRGAALRRAVLSAAAFTASIPAAIAASLRALAESSQLGPDPETEIGRATGARC
jgi:hypothetical protein